MKCDTCDRELLSPAAKNYGRCLACREAREVAESPAAAREMTDRTYAEGNAAKFGGRPWWECGRAVFVAAYPSVEALNVEAPFAGEQGYSITAITATDGHSNIGRTALGFGLAGGVGAAVAHSRTDGAIIVAWARRSL